MSAVAPGKICTVCGKDVAGKPRVKDSAGRYACEGACAAEMAARNRRAAAPQAPIKPVAVKPPATPAPPAPRPRPASPDPLASLIESAPTIGAKACPKCASPLTGGAVVCLQCGFNTETGRGVRTTVSKEKEEKAPRVKAVRGSGSRWARDDDGPSFGKLFLIMTGVCVLVGAVGAAGGVALWGSLAILALASLIAWIGGTIAAFKNDQTGWGVCGVCRIVPIVGGLAAIGFLIFNLLFNEDAKSRALYLATLIGSIVWAVGAGATGGLEDALADLR